MFGRRKIRGSQKFRGSKGLSRSGYNEDDRVDREPNRGEVASLFVHQVVDFAHAPAQFVLLPHFPHQPIPLCISLQPSYPLLSGLRQRAWPTLFTEGSSLKKDKLYHPWGFDFCKAKDFLDYTSLIEPHDPDHILIDAFEGLA